MWLGCHAIGEIARPLLDLIVDDSSELLKPRGLSTGQTGRPCLGQLRLKARPFAVQVMKERFRHGLAGPLVEIAQRGHYVVKI